MDSTTLAAIVVFTNRITELLKRALVTRLNVSDEVSGVIVLIVSFVVGFAGVLLVPAVNMFAGRGSSLIAEYILTAVVIGAGANGIDLFGKAVQSVLPAQTVTTAKIEIAPDKG